MAQLANTLDPGKTKGRMGWQLCPQVPAASLPYHFAVSSETLVNTPTAIVPTVIKGNRMPDKALPGINTAGGTIVSQMDAESFFPFVAQAQGGGTVVDNTPVFNSTYGELESGIVFSDRHLTVEIFRDDGQPQRMVDVLVVSIAWTVEAGGLLDVTFTVAAGWADYFGDAVLRAPSQLTAPAAVIGLENRAAWDGLTGDILIRLDSITVAAGAVPLSMAVVAKKGPEAVLTGTWTVGAGTNAFTSGAGAALTELVPGDYIDAAGELLQILAVADDDNFTTVGNHTAGAAGVTLVETFGPTASTLPKGLHATKGLAQYGELFDSRTGAPFGDLETFTRVEMFIDETLLTAPTPDVTLTGTVTHTIAADTLVGVGTLFLTELQVGQVVNLGDSITHRVKTIADDLNATTVAVRVDATAAGVALTAPPYWLVAQQRPDWVTAFTAAPLFNGLGIQLTVDGSPFDVTSAGVTITLPVVADNALGTKRAVKVSSRGLRATEVTFSRQAVDSSIVVVSELSAELVLLIDAKAPKVIPASSPSEQYGMTIFTGNLTVTSPRHSISSATERPEDVTAVPGQDAGGTYPEDVVITTANELDAASQTPP